MIEFLFLWLLLAIAIGIWAKNRGRDGAAWFLLSILVSPLIAGIFLAVSKNLATEHATFTGASCPECAEPVQAAAKVCKHCGHRLADGETWKTVERPMSALGKAKNSKAYRTAFNIVGVFFLIVIALSVLTRNSTDEAEVNTERAELLDAMPQ